MTLRFYLLVLAMLPIVGCSVSKPTYTASPYRLSENPYERPQLNYSISTYDDAPNIEVGISVSNASDDSGCSDSNIYTRFILENGVQSSGYYRFSRLYEPSVGLFEWHLCFTIDKKTYKAWRGFDPGPAGKIELTCFIPADLSRIEKPGNYLCKSQQVIIKQENYTEYGQHCVQKEGIRTCRSYESLEEYNLWQYFLDSRDALESLALAVLDDEKQRGAYDDGQNYPESIKIEGQAPSEKMSESLKRFGIIQDAKAEDNREFDVVRPLSESKIEFRQQGGKCGFFMDYLIELEGGQWKVKKIIDGTIPNCIENISLDDLF